MKQHTDPDVSPSLREMPGEELLTRVRAAFVGEGSSLNQWCRSTGITHAFARDVLLGNRNGPKARAMREKIMQATGTAQRHRMRLRVMEGRR